MRTLICVLGAVLIGAACANGDDPQSPEESARPELTADQIADEMRGVFPFAGDEEANYRATETRTSISPDGTTEEETTEEVVVGGDTYTRTAEGVELLTYMGRSYVRSDSSAEWRTSEELGFDFSALGGYFENLCNEFESASEDFFQDGGERLPDEFVNGRHALVVSVSLDDMLELFRRGLQQTLEELPTGAPGGEPPIPDRQTGDARFWIDAETLEPIRWRMEIVGYVADEEVHRLEGETTYSDINAVEELPVDLPSNPVSRPSPTSGEQPC
jgi:hypothetical protein